MKRRENGVYYTKLCNPFDSIPFYKWIKKYALRDKKILEPFAGSNSIISFLQEIGMAKKYQSYDINPSASNIYFRDTIASYPTGFDCCITNPPWFYKSSAIRRKNNYPNTHYNNIYKLCLHQSLKNNLFVVMLLPASFATACFDSGFFLRENLFYSRLETVIFINKPLFLDTENPVCLALFTSKKTSNIYFYNDNEYIGNYQKLASCLPHKKSNKIRFNIPNGELGFIAIDNHKSPSIRFCKGEELENYKIKNSSRSITRITGLGGERVSDNFLTNINNYVMQVRKKTQDVFLTPFKGLRVDGKYRRRMSYAIARKIIGSVL